MIKVWTDAAEAGLLDRYGERGSTFAYLPDTPAARAVSITMPVRLPSWSVPFGLPPIFEMNLPEGFLRERLRLAFAKATGTLDEFDLLSIVGRSQVGRSRYTGDKEQLHEDVPFQSVDEILERKRGGDLFRYLVERFASFSGISGVQPKILVRDEKAFAEMEHTGHRLSHSYLGATHIVKLWEPNEYPQLAANEYFCLTAARKCRLDVPPYRLAEDGMALVIDRFDLRMDGTYRGFEDFCALNARRTDEKYRGSYETQVMKRFAQFANSTHVNEDTEKLFTLIVLNCALRNGDAHLKNFGVVYDDVLGEARLALHHYRAALRVRPEWTQVSNNLAWLLATHPDADVVLFLIDARAGVTPIDKHFANWLRRAGTSASACAMTSKSKDFYMGSKEFLPMLKKVR